MNKIKIYIKKQQITVKEFASTIGVRRETIYKYINNSRTPSPKTMRKIVEVTNGKIQPNDFY